MGIGEEKEIDVRKKGVEDERRPREEMRSQQRAEGREALVSCWEDQSGAPLMSAGRIHTHTHTHTHTCTQQHTLQRDATCGFKTSRLRKLQRHKQEVAHQRAKPHRERER